MNFVFFCARKEKEPKALPLYTVIRERIVNICIIDGDRIYLYENITTTKKKR